MNIIKTLSQLLRQRSKDERGVAVVEYAIMLALVSLAVTAFGQGISGAVTDVFSRLLDIIA